MNSQNAIARRNARAKKLLLAACGIAGCTGGPNLSSASSEVPTVLVQSTERAQPVEMHVSRSLLASHPTTPARSIWGHRTAEQHIAPIDPFVANTSGGFRATGMPANSRPKAQAPVLPVGFDEANAYCDTPRKVTIQPRGEQPGVVRIKDGRLPPAAPLGAANPFQVPRAPAMAGTKRSQAPTIVAKPAVDSTPVSTHVAKPVASTSRVEIRPASRPVESPVPMEAFLSGQLAADGTDRETLQNDDMIVDSAILPKRADWRAETLPPRGDADASVFAISPRRPFATPEWDDPSPQSSSSANVPIEITPAAAFERHEADLRIAKRSEMPAVSDLTPAPIVPEPFDAPADPFATAATTEAPAFVTAEQDPFEIAAAPLLAPGTVVSTRAETLVSNGPVVTQSEAVSGPSLQAPAANRIEASGSAAKVADVEPVSLDAANAAAALEAAESQKDAVGTPTVIGIALAIVAFGAVMIRRRFA